MITKTKIVVATTYLQCKLSVLFLENICVRISLHLQDLIVTLHDVRHDWFINFLFTNKT